MGDGFFFRYIKSKRVNSDKYKRELADKICAHPMKYVTVSTPDNGDKVIGKNCVCRLDDGYFTATDEKGILLFKAGFDSVKLFELMSLDGAVISGSDEVTGKDTEITAHYSYYR